jgi:copper oxidase (laccase) domain-containing protein
VLHDPVAGLLACVHAGWRGTAAGVAAATVAVLRDLGSRPADIHAAIGPAIPAARYQVGPEVHAALTQPRPAPSPPSPAPALESPAAADIVRPDPAAPGRWLLDLPAANRLALREAGVPDAQIHASHLPTGPIDPSENMNAENPAVLADRGYFFSDRAARPCGRHALIARLPGTARPR